MRAMASHIKSAHRVHERVAGDEEERGHRHEKPDAPRLTKGCFSWERRERLAEGIPLPSVVYESKDHAQHDQGEEADAYDLFTCEGYAHTGIIPTGLSRVV